MIKKLLKKLKNSKLYIVKNLVVGNIIQLNYVKHFNILNVTNFDYHTLNNNQIFIKQNKSFFKIDFFEKYEKVTSPQINKNYIHNIIPFYEFYHLKDYGYTKHQTFSLEELIAIQSQGENWFKEHSKNNHENLVK